MSVDLTPQELGFRRPFNHEVNETLKLGNPNNAPVAFKVKTTAPKQYCVRPNSGIIQPNSSVEVQVLLQAMKEDPPLDAKCRDKFLVQSVLTTSDNADNVANIWSNVEKTAKSSIQERKIRVNFLAPGEGAAVNGVGTQHEEEPPAYSSPSPQFGSPATHNTVAASTTSKSVSEPKAPTSNAAEPSTAAGSVYAAVSNAVPTSSDELQQQLAAAKAQIAKLTSQISDPQVRQRKVQEASEKMQTVVQQSNESGVPVQIVAGLCLLSFLIAYLFF